MLWIALLTALALMVAIIAVLLRALGYLREHPELITNSTPPAYLRCQTTLRRIVQRYHQLVPLRPQTILLAWQAPSGLTYTLSSLGITCQRGPGHTVPITALPWPEIGGVGVRMESGFSLADRDSATETTTSYTFALIIVPFQGSTLTIPIPTEGSDEAVNFAAHILALAEAKHKRINVFGFDRPPVSSRQRRRRL